MRLTLSLLAAGVLAFSTWACGGNSASKAGASAATAEVADSLPAVYYIKDITPANLVKIYEALGRKAEGKNVGIKLSTGESDKSNHLDTALIRDLVQLVNGTIIECNTAYAGNRNTTEAHYKAAVDHGFTAIARVDIMDGEGDTILPLTGGKHLDKDIVGKSFPDYDFIVVLSHFKGHAMGGFGGALKNISIGIASSSGKAYIHSAGATTSPDSVWGKLPEQDDFLESMAEAAKAVIDHTGDRILYISVANRLSVDCDCDGNPAAPEMADLGILASLDPVALDRACVDMVMNSDDPGKGALIERINSRHGTHILTHAEKLGLGSQKYNLITITE